MAQSLAFDSMHPAGKLPPTLTPTGHFAGKPTLPISRSVTLIGSRKQARLQLISSTVSQNHALIVNADSGPYIRDLASREFTFVNGIQVREGPLSDGDEIQIGRFTFRFNESPHTQPVEAIRKIMPAPAGTIAVDGAEMPIPIDGKSVLIGRRDTCDIPLLEESVSTTHAIIFEMDGHRYIRDLASRSGTFVNGKQVHQIELMPDDEVRIGETKMRYVAEAGSARPTLPAVPADLGAMQDDLVELEAEAPRLPIPQPRAKGTPPKPPQAAPIAPRAPIAAPAGSDALELVQDQSAETEDIELTPVDLEAHPIPIEAEAAEPEPDPAESIEPEIDLEPIAPAHVAAAPEADELLTIEPIAEAEEVELEPVVEAEPEPAAEPMPLGELEIHDDTAEVEAEEHDDLVDLLPRVHETPHDEPAEVELEALHIEPEAEVEAEPEDEAPEEIAEAPAHVALTAQAPLEPIAEVGGLHAADLPDEDEEDAEPVAIQPAHDDIERKSDHEASGSGEVAAVAVDPEDEFRPAPEPLAEADDAVEVDAEAVDAEAAEEEVEAESKSAPETELDPAASAEAEPSDELEPAAAFDDDIDENHEPVEASEAIDDVLGLESLAPVEPAPLPPSRLAPGMSQLHLEPVSDIEADTFHEEPEPVAEAPKPTKPASAAKPPSTRAAARDAVRPAPDTPRFDDFKAPEEPAEFGALDFSEEPDDLPVLDFNLPESADLEDEIGVSPSLTEPAAQAAPPPAKKKTAPAAPAPAPVATPEDEFPELEEPDTSELTFAAPADIEALPEDIFGSLDEAAVDLPPLDLGTAPDEAIPGFPEGLPDTDALDLGLETAPAPVAKTPAAKTPVAKAPAVEAPTPTTPTPSKPAVEASAAKAPTAKPPAAATGKKGAGKAAREKKPPKQQPRRKPPAPITAEAPPDVAPPDVTAPVAASVVEAAAIIPAVAAVVAPVVAPIAKMPRVAPAKPAPEPVAETPRTVTPPPAPKPAPEPVVEAPRVVTPPPTPTLRMVEPVAEAPREVAPTAPSAPKLVPPSAPKLVVPPAPVAPPPPVAPAPSPELKLQPIAEPIAPDVEIIESTEATPESALDSALDLDDAGATSLSESSALGEAQSVDLTDTSFGRAVESFVGESTGPIVEQRHEDAAAELLESSTEVEPEPIEVEPGAAHATPEPDIGPQAAELEEEVEIQPVAPAPQAILSEPIPVGDDDALDLVELEPVSEAATAKDEPVSLLPQAETASADAFKDEPLEKLFHIGPLPTTSRPAEEELELEPVDEAPTEREKFVELGKSIEDHAPIEVETEPVEVESEPIEAAELDAEPVEVEAIEPEPALQPEPVAELEPLVEPATEAHTESHDDSAPVELDIDDADLVALEALEPESPQAAHAVEPAEDHELAELGLDEAPVASGATDDELGGWELELDEEAAVAEADTAAAPSAAAADVSEAEVSAADVAADEPTPQPVADAPAPSPRKAPSPVDPFNWGANQEHFLGGRPLQLNAPPASPPVAPAPHSVPPTPQPVARPAAERVAPPPPPRAPLIEDRPSTVEPIGPALPLNIPPQAIPRPPRAGVGTQNPRSKPAQVSTGFDGLALGPVREADVFGQFIGGFDNGGVADDVFGRRTAPTPSPNPNSPQPPAGGGGGKRPPAARRASKSEPSGDAWSPTSDASSDSSLAAPTSRPPASARPPELPAVPPPPRKKRKWFGFKSLVIGMVVCMCGAAGGIYYAIPNESAVVGRFKFANISALPQLQLNNLESDQKTILSGLQQTLKSTGASTFFSNPAAYPKLVSSAALDRKTGVMTISYVGGTSAQDQTSMLSLLKILYDRNRPMVDEANELNHTVESLTRDRAAATKTIDEIAQKIDELNAAAQNRPDSAQRAKLESEAAQLDATYEAAKQTVKALSSELKQLQDNGSATSVQPATNDTVLQQLQGELKQLNDRVSTVQDGRSEKAKQAREKLDSALVAFNQQIDQAQGAVKNNPDLVAYLNSAQKLMTSTRDLTDQLIKRQQDQYGKLSELKTSLNDKMLARRAGVWKKDPELLKLMDQKDIKTRQYNAAVGQNMTKEADDLKAELSLLDSMIKARQTVVADDGFLAETIDQLQKIVDATQKGLTDDRKLTMQKLDELQTSVARSQPRPDNLTPEQKQLAAEMGKRLEDVSLARRQYTEAADAANQQADEEMRSLQTNASDLSSKVQARKKELGDATTAAEAVAPAAASGADRNRLIEQKTAELAAAEKMRADAEAASNAVDKKLRDLKARVDDARAAGEKHDALVRQKDIAVQNKVQLDNQYDLKKKLAEQKAYPLAPTEADVARDPKPDKRPVYTLAAVGSIVGVFVCLLLISGSGREDAIPVAPAYATDDFDFAPANGDPDATMEMHHERPSPVEV